MYLCSADLLCINIFMYCFSFTLNFKLGGIDSVSRVSYLSVFEHQLDINLLLNLT